MSVHTHKVQEDPQTLSPRPFRCVTTERIRIPCDKSDWISCWEWCLSAPGGNACLQLIVDVRENGTDLAMSGCRMEEDVSCQHYHEDEVYTYDCKVSVIRFQEIYRDIYSFIKMTICNSCTNFFLFRCLYRSPIGSSCLRQPIRHQPLFFFFKSSISFLCTSYLPERLW